MIETVCAKFRKQNHPNNTLLLTWAAFLSHFRPILHDLIRKRISLLGFRYHIAANYTYNRIPLGCRFKCENTEGAGHLALIVLNAPPPLPVQLIIIPKSSLSI